MAYLGTSFRFTSPSHLSSSLSSSFRFPHRSLGRYVSTVSTAGTPSTAPSIASTIPKLTKKGDTSNKVESLRGNNQLISLLKYNPGTPNSSNGGGTTAGGYRSHQQIMEPLSADITKGWTPQSVRTGLIGIKAGMTTDWDSWGVRKTLTVIKLEDVIVTGIRTVEDHGYSALQIGSLIPKALKLDKATLGHFASLGIAPRTHLAEFRVTPDAIVPVGSVLTCRHFVPGQYVAVTGTNQGKGFQGAMKRHGFSGQGASHGNSVSHRVLGATGCRQDPGKVIKGKKMPGHMGTETVTIEVAKVYKIDIKHNLVYIEGAAPGKPGTLLRIRDSLRKPFTVKNPPPFPTYSLNPKDQEQLVKWSLKSYLTPTEEHYLIQQNLLPTNYEREPPYELIAPPPTIDPFAIPENDEPEEH